MLDTIYASIAQVKASREEVMLLLGRQHESRPEQKQVRIRLEKVVRMSPATAKRLSALLGDALRAHESRYGSFDAPGFLEERLLPTPPMAPPAFASKAAAEKADRCLRLLERLGIRPAFERSVKMKKHALLSHRFLFGFEKSRIGPNPDETLLQICEQIGMPPDLMAAFLENLPEAGIVGFGFGENETTCIAKAYLEFGIRYYRAMESEASAPKPYRSHLGFKWDVEDETMNVVTRYTCFPGYTKEEMLEGVSNTFSGDSRPLQAVKGILDAASARAGRQPLLFLGVDEKENPRKSFDVNLYPANLRVSEIRAFFSDICRYFRIPDPDVERVYAAIRRQVLGHIAGGVDRKGKAFATLYFAD